MIRSTRRSLAELRLQIASMVAVCLVVLMCGYLTLSEINVQLEASRVANADNRTWVAAQLEVDMLNLKMAAMQAQMAGGDADSLAQLREKFDIFYSRTKLVDGKLSPVVKDGLSYGMPVWDAELGLLTVWTPVIDGPDAALVAALPELVADITTQARQTRTAIAGILSRIMANSDARRDELADSLHVFTYAAVALLVLLTGLVVMVVVQSRTRYRRGVLLERSVHNLRATIESSLDGVVVLDHLGRIMECNRAAETMFRWEHDEAQGTDFVNCIRKESASEAALPHLRSDLVSGQSHGTDGRLTMTAIRKDGSVFPIEVSVAEAQGTTQDPFFISFIRDISERIDREEALKRARNAAQKGEEAKSRFLAVMSHEMRTPLNGLMAASDLLTTSTVLDDRQKSLCDIINSCALAALDQVNNVLALTRLNDAEGESYASIVFSPTDMIADLVKQAQPHAQKGGNRLWFTPPRQPVPQVFAPRQLFLRVLYNLIGNAIKFTENGKISVELMHADGPAPGTVQLSVSVIDTGIGIAAKDLEVIFRNFETLDSSYSRIHEGSGLGLGIAKLSAEAMGGRISVQSRLGLGSSFIFTATFQIAAEQGEGVPATPAAPGVPAVSAPRDILVAEDNAINRQLLSEILRLAGHSVTEAEDGEKAVQLARAQAFDLILMDISMPRVDGLEAARDIRREGLSAQTPIIGVTANANPERFNDFLAAGMDDVVIKPIARPVLFAAIDKARPRDRLAPHAPPSPCTLVDLTLKQDLSGELGDAYWFNMARRTLAEADETLEGMATLHAAGDAAQAARLAHRTAGAAAVIGLCLLGTTLSRYETATADADATDAAAALAALPDVIARTHAALATLEAA